MTIPLAQSMWRSTRSPRVWCRDRYWRARDCVRRWRGERLMRVRGGYDNGTRIVPLERGATGNAAIAQLLATGKPAMVTRYGVYELRAVAGTALNDHALVRRWFFSLCHDAGFFPQDLSLVPRFAQVYLNATRFIDALAAVNHRQGLYETEQWIFQTHCPHARLIEFESIDSFRYENPWTAALEGKRVLVVHPFVETIRRQYAKRKLLFANPRVLPDFASLQIVPAIQSIAGNRVPFANWFDALDHMRRSISNCDFDVALIGAGAYGLPLAAHVRQMGRQAVHMGGVTQVLFGIYGSRWQQELRHLINEHWVRPADHERPVGAFRVEHGCYW